MALRTLLNFSYNPVNFVWILHRIKRVDLQIMVGWISLSAELFTLFFWIACTQLFLPQGEMFSVSWVLWFMTSKFKDFKLLTCLIACSSMNYHDSMTIRLSSSQVLKWILTLQNWKALESKNSRGGSQLLWQIWHWRKKLSNNYVWQVFWPTL